jgi:spermidine synthase
MRRSKSVSKRRRSHPARKPRSSPEARPKTESDGVQTTIYAAFFLSGLAGLMHEVVWTKQLVQLIGSTAYAQAAVLAAFMGGLALGSVLLGRRVDRAGRPLRTYVILELLIAGYCLLLPVFLHVAGLGYVALGTQFFESASFKGLSRFVLSLLVVLFPSVLMGGTLPVLARHLIGQVSQTQRRVAGLYGLNNFGAVLGAGIAGFVALPLVGVYPSLAIASLCNLAAGALVVPLARREGAAAGAPPMSAPAEGRAPAGQAYRTEQYVVTLVALALSGFAAMGYEVLFIRIIGLAFGSSTFSFTVMLMSFITGIGLGSAIVSRLRVRRPLWLLAISQLAVVVALIAATPLVSRLPYLLALLRIDLQAPALGFELFQLAKASLCLAVLLLPTTCLGFSFPLVAQVQARHPSQVGARVGSTYAWNTVGNVLGVVGTSLVLVPWLGLLGAFHFNLALNLAAGVALLVVAGEVALGRRFAAAATAAVVSAAYLAAGTGWSDSISRARGHLRIRSRPESSLSPLLRSLHPLSSFDSWKRTFVAREAETPFFFFEEDAHATVLVSGDEKDDLTLYVNGKADAGLGRDVGHQLLIAHVPLFMVPQARTLLVIGHGSGMTSGSALRHPIEQMDVVEISPAVLHADALFADRNYGALQDPRVRTYVDDAQSFLRTVPRTYDVIISQPTNPSIKGVGGLFTVEFFEHVRDKLNQGGAFAFWFQEYEQSDEMVELVLRTLGAVFPHVQVFRDFGFLNLFAVASLERIEPDFEAMERRYGHPAVRADLARIGVPNLAGFLAHHSVSEERFPKLLRPGPLNRVGHQRLEYSAPRSFFWDQDSGFLERFDPFLLNGDQETDALLDRYLAHRKNEGDPAHRKELLAAQRYVEAGGQYGAALGEALQARARRAPPATGAR